MSETVSPAFSDVSAQDTALAAQEAQEWIEAVTGRTFSSSFRKSLEDGVILCELMTKLYPDSIRRINRAKSPIAHLDNIQQFLFACKDLGLKDAQLFDKMDLQEAKGIKAKGVKRNEADRRIRSVCVTLYWLGQVIADMDDYSGPQLDLDAFKRIMYGTPSVNNVTNSNGMASPRDGQPNHFKLNVEKKKDTSPAPDDARTIHVPRITQEVKPENGLTVEQEQTADQLLADIQNAVDEMLLDFQTSPVVSPEPPSPAPAFKTKPAQDELMEQSSGKKVGMTITMNSINGGFGFRIVGGRDINADMIPQVDLVAPEMAADKAGLKEGDELVSVNKQDVSYLNHEALVSMIKQAGAEGSVMLGVIRTVQSKGNDPPKYERDEVDTADPQLGEETHEAWEAHQREQERQAHEIASMYRRGPPPTVGSQPLPPLVEHQEESALEQINELLESTPVPPPQSTSPSPPPSPPTPTISPPHLFNEREDTRPLELQDDRETIERELQELALMEMAKPPSQSEEELSVASSGKQSGPFHTTADESPIIPTKQELISKTCDINVEENAALPQAAGGSKNRLDTAEVLDDDKDLERHLQDLLEFTEMANKDIVPLPLIESPPPPPPQAEVPKRQQVQAKDNSPPSTKPKPTRKAPAPPKQKTTKKASSKRNGNEESILSQKTRLPSQAEVKQQIVSKVETKNSPPVSKYQEPEKPVPSQQKKEEIAEQKVDVKQPEPEKRSTGRRLVFTPPPPPISPPSSPPPSEEQTSIPEQKMPEIIDNTAEPGTTDNTPVMPAPQVFDSTPPTTAELATLTSLDATPNQPLTGSPPKPTQTVQSNKSTPSKGSYHKEEMRTQTTEDVEIIGAMKISRVQRTKWTPKGSLTEFVTSPTAPIRGPFQEQFQQHYSYPMENSTEAGRSEVQQRPGKRSDVYQRYSQPERVLMGAEYLNSHGMQQVPGKYQPSTHWKSQEELRIKQLPQQNHNGQQSHQQQQQQQPTQHRRTPPQQHHTHQRQQQQQQQTYTPTHHKQQAASYRQSSVPNGHTGKGASYQSASLPRSRQEDVRVNRSKTWSAVDRGPKDGPHPAYAVKAGNPYELCSRCHQMLGGGPVMAIPGAKTQYHLQCFVCRMCRNPLVGTIPKNTLVIMKNRHPHCHRCVSSSKDTVMTEC